MKAANFSLVNGIILILFGAWGYLSSETPSPTALIPTFIGALILATNYGMRLGKKPFKYLALVLTALVLLGLLKPLSGVIGRQDMMGVFRVAVMMATSILAIYFLVINLFGKKE